MKKVISFTIFAAIILISQGLAQNVGIGTNTPVARLHVIDSSVVFSGSGLVSSPADNPPITGTGRRMMWYANKAAFRTGYVAGSNWDNDSVGAYSFAGGFDAKAKGLSSFSFGTTTSSLANYSTAFGINTIASGEYSTAMGFYSRASGNASTAIGAEAVAKAAGSMTTGLYNDTMDTPDPSIVLPTDRIFQVGNGLVTRSNAMTVLRSGYVGIGTTTPATSLHIKSGDSNPVVIDGGNQMWVTLAENGINRGYIGSYTGNADDVELGTYGGTAGAVHLTTNNAPKLTVINNGNVGINTTAPSEKLEVAGNVKADSYKYTAPKTYYHSIPGAAFDKEIDTDTIYKDFSSVYFSSLYNTSNYMIAPVSLPHGATITGLTVYYIDNSSTNNLRVDLYHQLHSNGISGAVASITSSGTPGITNSTDNTITAPSLVNNLTGNYKVEAYSTPGAWPFFSLQIFSVVISYTLTEVQ